MAWVQWASMVTPSTRKARVELMATRVMRALRASGGRKLCTPLEMASNPVSEEPPLAKERSRVTKARPMSRPEPGVPILPP